MTTTSRSDWFGTLTAIIDDLRRLDLTLTNDTRVEPAAAGEPHQLDSTVSSTTRLTSQGELLAELEWSGRIKWWHRPQAPASAAGSTAALTAPVPEAASVV
jgi:hypothetical protein